MTTPARTSARRGHLGPDRPHTEGSVVPDVFRRRAAQTPDACAVWDGTRGLSYAELDRRSDAVAAVLRDAGVVAEATAAVVCEPSAELVVALLAVLKAGGAFVTVDAHYPPERIRFLLDDARPVAVLTQPELVGMLPRSGPATIVLDRDGVAGTTTGSIAAANVEMGPTVDPDAPACVIYTSGSTARPKGVVITHRGLVNLCRAAIRRFGLAPGDRFLQLASVSFSAFLEETFPSLLSGATVVPAGYRRALVSVPSLLKTLRAERITGFGITTAYWHELVDEMTATGLRFPPELRFVLMGGEQAGARQVAAWPGLAVPMVHVYGPTELTATATYFHTGEADPRILSAGRLPLGTVIENTSVWLLDEWMRPVDEGGVGEVYLGGDSLARGYLGQPGLTADRFVPDPFGAPGTRLYRTGDLACRSSDGELEFRGRVDDQQKLRGFRVEPAEVEAAVQRYPGVRRAVALVREDRPGDRRLVVYLVPTPGVEMSTVNLRAELASNLPDYLVPSAVVALAELPLSPNGKLDRAALPPPPADRAPAASFAAPLGAVQEAVAACFAEVCDVARVGADDDFFTDLGGDSLRATRAVARLRTARGVDVTVADIFAGPTVRALARTIAACGPAPEVTGAGEEADDLVQAGRRRVLIEQALAGHGTAGASLLSVSQQGLWVHDQMVAGTALYNVPVRWRLTGELDQAALRQAIDRTVARQDVLRSRFGSVQGRGVQIADPSAQVPLRVVDLRRHSEHLDSGDPVDRAGSVVDEEVRRPFDLGGGPAFRVLLVRLADAEHLLVCTAHHLIFDGWSARVLFDEIATGYAAAVGGRAVDPAPLPVRYADFAVWQRERLRGQRLESLVEFWRQQLDGAPAISAMPTDRPRRGVTETAGAHLRMPLPADLAGAVAALAAAERATPFMAYLAVFVELLRRRGGRDDVCVGVPVANRARAEFERLIGFFVNMVVLRVDRSDERPAGSCTWRELVRRVRRECLAAYAHQELPFDRLVEALRPPREPGVNPYFQVNFTVDEVSGPAGALPGLRVSEGSEVGAGTAKFEQSWLVETDRGDTWLSVDYATELFDRDTVVAVAQDYRALLRSMVDDPDAPVQAVAPPRVEDVLAEMWSQAFGGTPVGEHDDFFELGGYSVLAAQMCQRIRELFEIDLPLRVFFENSTIAEIADRIRSAGPVLAIAGSITSGSGLSTVDSLGELLAEIESMPDDEVAAAILTGDERATDVRGGSDG